MHKILLYFAVKYNGDWEAIYKALDNKEKIKPEDVDSVYEEWKGKYVTILDSNYPTSLKKTWKPPFVVFFKGDLSVITNANKLFVGSEEEVTEETKKEIKELGFTTLTRDLRDNPDISILSTPINFDEDYNSIVVSEFVKPVDDSKLIDEMTNRFIAGLSDNSYVISAKAGSQLEDIINHQIEVGVNIFVKPVTGKENLINNKLIKLGATLVEETKQIVNN